MGSYPKQISSYIRPNHVFTSFKRNVLTCLQTKNLKPLSHSYDELKKKKKKNFHVQPATRYCMTKITKLKCNTLVWKKVPPSSLKEMAKYWPSSERRLAIVRLLLHVSIHTPYMFLFGALYNKQYINYSEITKIASHMWPLSYQLSPRVFTFCRLRLFFFPSIRIYVTQEVVKWVCGWVCVCVQGGGGGGWVRKFPFEPRSLGVGKLTR